MKLVRPLGLQCGFVVLITSKDWLNRFVAKTSVLSTAVFPIVLQFLRRKWRLSSGRSRSLLLQFQVHISVDRHTNKSCGCPENASHSGIWTEEQKTSEQNDTCFELSKDDMSGCRCFSARKTISREIGYALTIKACGDQCPHHHDLVTTHLKW